MSTSSECSLRTPPRPIGASDWRSRRVSSWPLALDRLDLLMTTHVKAYRLAPGRRAPCPARRAVRPNRLVVPQAWRARPPPPRLRRPLRPRPRLQACRARTSPRPSGCTRTARRQVRRGRAGAKWVRRVRERPWPIGAAGVNDAGRHRRCVAAAGGSRVCARASASAPPPAAGWEGGREVAHAQGKRSGARARRVVGSCW